LESSPGVVGNSLDVVGSSLDDVVGSSPGVLGNPPDILGSSGAFWEVPPKAKANLLISERCSICEPAATRFRSCKTRGKKGKRKTKCWGENVVSIGEFKIVFGVGE
jgi:hypothetical protein